MIAYLTDDLWLRLAGNSNTRMKRLAASLGDVTPRNMFGGTGLYSDGVFFGLIARDVLYFKVDDTNRGDYEARGSEPFRPYDDRPYSMSYHEVPVEVLEKLQAGITSS